MNIFLHCVWYIHMHVHTGREARSQCQASSLIILLVCAFPFYFKDKVLGNLKLTHGFSCASWPPNPESSCLHSSALRPKHVPSHSASSVGAEDLRFGQPCLHASISPTERPLQPVSPSKLLPWMGTSANRAGPPVNSTEKGLHRLISFRPVSSKLLTTLGLSNTLCH